MKRLLLIGALVVVALSACSKGQSTGAAPTQVQAEQSAPLDLSTPDRALKSYWQVRDSVHRKINAFASDSISRVREIHAETKSASTGALAESLGLLRVQTNSYSRDIIDVKVESESRAVITTVIKNITPVPAGAEVTKYDEARRRDGDRYRYVLERSQEGWKVAEIWEWSEYMPEKEWKKSWPRDNKPQVGTATYDAV